MNKLREAAEMALDALENVFGKGKRCEAAITALRQALAEKDECETCAAKRERLTEAGLLKSPLRGIDGEPNYEPVVFTNMNSVDVLIGTNEVMRVTGDGITFSDHVDPIDTSESYVDETEKREHESVAWIPIEQMYPQANAIDILMGDGSILCAVLPQFDGDLWWGGSGTGEKFIDPKYANVTHWRIHSDTTPPSKQEQAEKQEPYAYIYETNGAFGVHQSLRNESYNGRYPDKTIPVYTEPMSTKPENVDTKFECVDSVNIETVELKHLRDVHDAQGSDGAWNSNQYMCGLFNGLELALSIFENREPAYKDLAQPEQEPVAWMYEQDGETHFGHPDGYHPSNAAPLYAGETK